MLANQVHELRDQLQMHGIVFAYSGYVTESILSGVGDALKQKLAIEDADTKTVRSVFAVFVEQMQNIIRYSAERIPQQSGPKKTDIPELSYGILTIGQEGTDYVVQAGNMIKLGDVTRMKQRLGGIRDMNRDELKAAYKKQLRIGPDIHSKGAGIGFIEIARRASTPIDFDFMDIDDKFAFFALKATIRTRVS